MQWTSTHQGIKATARCQKGDACKWDVIYKIRTKVFLFFRIILTCERIPKDNCFQGEKKSDSQNWQHEQWATKATETPESDDFNVLKLRCL